MTAEDLTAQGQASIQHLVPNAPVEATTLYSAITKRHIYRLRLATHASITTDVCVMGNTAEQCLKRFLPAVQKRLSQPTYS